ncbi:MULTISPECIES: hypothetical protein [Paraburkholderia]|uniref:Uncharacterized protein n=1 Tax=Paraburkholderia madseniana TaxID=2599607 RepID=A0ABT3USB1_9BURK|nr:MULTISPECIES: hypothetical protein [Paraburkholderia]MCX4151675.1 hypothetical protein [Paraburkholderia madseniana]MCX4176950.1 hypothetical protein [Paraburkholderia madseniana]
MIDSIRSKENSVMRGCAVTEINGEKCLETGAHSRACRPFRQG